MITIKFIANRLKDFCNNNEKVEKFKVYIRLNFSLEIYAIINSNYSQDSFIEDFIWEEKFLKYVFNIEKYEF